MPTENTSGLSAQQRHFGTEHLLGNLKERTISSGIVRAVAQGAQFVLNLGYNIVLARLLTPQEFGLVAMVMTVMGTLQIFREMGLSTATIQRADITQAQVSNLFWLNVAVSGTISVLIAAGSPLIASFYQEPRLVNIALALSGYFVLNGLAGQHVALLNRQMRFVLLSVVEVGSMAISLVVGIAMALMGYGYWSLVAATLIQAVLRLVAVWSVSRWRPQRPMRGVGTRPLIKFGADLTVSGLIYSFSQGCDSLVIGRVYGPDAVGLYSRAATLLLRPMQQLITPIYTVTVPALSRLQDQPERYRRFYLDVFEVLIICGFIFTGLVLPLARPLTVSILGVHWEAAATIFAGLSAAAIYVPLSSAISWLYISQGRGRDMMWATLIVAGVSVGSVFIGLPYGPAGVAIALSISGLALHLPITFYIAGRKGTVGTRDLWFSFFKHLHVFLITCGATAAVYLAAHRFSPIAQLLICAPSGLLASAITIMIFSPSRGVALRVLGALDAMRKDRPQGEY